MATNHSLDEILRIMQKDLNIYDDLKLKKINKKSCENEFYAMGFSMKKLKDLEKWASVDLESDKREIENIKVENAKMMAKAMGNTMSKNNKRPDGLYYNAYKNSSSRSQKYGLERDSTIFNNQIFRLLMDNLTEDKKIYNIILRDSPLFPHDEIKTNSFLNQHDSVYLVVTDEKTDKLLGGFNFTACRMWIEHVGTESSYKKYPNTYIKIIKKSKTDYKIVVSKTRPLLEVRDDKVIQYSKENKL